MECFLDDTASLQSRAFLWEGGEEGSWLSAGAGALPQRVQSCLPACVPRLCPRLRESALDVPPGGRAIGTWLQCLGHQSADTGLVHTADALVLSPPRGAQLVHLPASMPLP